MNILIVSQYFYPETFRVNTFSQELVKRGHQVTVLTGYPQYPYGRLYEGYGLRTPYQKEWNGVRIERVKTRPRGKNAIGLLMNCLTYVVSGCYWVRKCKETYDAVYVFGVSPATTCIPAITYGKKFDVPVYYNVQDLWPESVEEVLGIHNKLVIGVINKMVNSIYKNSEKILCSSSAFIDRIADRGVSRDKLVYWPQFCETPKLEELKAPDCYSDDAFHVVFAGNLGYAQGLELLIDTAENMRELPVQWYLVGDGRAKEELYERVQAKKLEQKVHFIGRVSEQEANAYVKYADCAYLSYKKSKLLDMTIPAKLQTYLACGVPIVGAVGGESAKIIQNAKCGMVAERNTDAVAARVTGLMAMSQQELHQIRKNGKAYFENNFTKERLITEFEELVRQ